MKRKTLKRTAQFTIAGLLLLYARNVTLHYELPERGENYSKVTGIDGLFSHTTVTKYDDHRTTMYQARLLQNTHFYEDVDGDGEVDNVTVEHGPLSNLVFKYNPDRHRERNRDHIQFSTLFERGDRELAKQLYRFKSDLKRLERQRNKEKEKD